MFRMNDLVAWTVEIKVHRHAHAYYRELFTGIKYHMFLDYVVAAC